MSFTVAYADERRLFFACIYFRGSQSLFWLPRLYRCYHDANIQVGAGEKPGMQIVSNSTVVHFQSSLQFISRSRWENCTIQEPPVQIVA